MSVRHVLTAVLPRYTMRRTPRPDPPARTPGFEPYPPEYFAELRLRRLAEANRRDLDVMGHD